MTVYTACLLVMMMMIATTKTTEQEEMPLEQTEKEFAASKHYQTHTHTFLPTHSIN